MFSSVETTHFLEKKLTLSCGSFPWSYRWW